MDSCRRCRGGDQDAAGERHSVGPEVWDQGRADCGEGVVYLFGRDGKLPVDVARGECHSLTSPTRAGTDAEEPVGGTRNDSGLLANVEEVMLQFMKGVECDPGEGALRGCRVVVDHGSLPVVAVEA